MGNSKRRPSHGKKEIYVDSHSDESISDDESSISLHEIKRFKASEDHNSDVQWYDKYAPQKSQDICINPRKLKEIRECLQRMVNGTTEVKMLILTGPPGSSKSTTVKILADEIFDRFDKPVKGIESYLDDHETSPSNRWIEYLESSSSGSNQSHHFESFLNESKYKMNCVVLIEDLPNVFNEETLRRFRSSILEWIYSSQIENLPPLILCVSETHFSTDENNNVYYGIENNISAETLLTRDILNSNKVKCVKVNAIAASFMKKTINQVISKEKRIFSRLPKPELIRFLDSLVKIGDIRSSLANLQMWTTIMADNTRKSLLDIYSARENNLNLFHAIGKVLYSSSDFRDLDVQESDFRSVEAVIENSSSSNLALLNLSIAENYSVINNGDFSIKIATTILDNLSISDTLDSLAEGCETGIRAARSELRKVNQKSSRQMGIKFSRYFNMLKSRRRTTQDIKDYQRYINQLRNNFDTINLIDGYFLPLIYNSKKYRITNKATNMTKYNRIGGRFEEIYADDSFALNEEMINSVKGAHADQFGLDIARIARMKNDLDDEYNEELSDPIETSDEDVSSSIDHSKEQGDNDIFDDSLIDKVDLLLQEQKSTFTQRMLESDDFSSDPELDVLISQRRL